jgi:3-dehydro-L-gulonate-6-phosphate decarboxylase
LPEELEKVKKMDRKLPMLQVALDTNNLDTALSATRQVHDVVDILEVGTILCLAEGLGAVKTIKTLYPGNLVLADVRIAEAGALIADMVFDAGADWVSVLSSASLQTMQVVADRAFKSGGDVQIELQDEWSIEKAKQWFDLGIKQIIFHRSRDAEKLGLNWDNKTLDAIQEFSEMGYLVSVTGKMSPDDIPLFRGIPVYAFVAGRAIRDAKNPRAAAEQFQSAIKNTWK